MNDVSKELLSLLDLEPLELNLFRGIGTGGETSTRIFGGHVIAQALAAAYRTVEERMCHSLHAYFVRPGDPSMPWSIRWTAPATGAVSQPVGL